MTICAQFGMFFHLRSTTSRPTGLSATRVAKSALAPFGPIELFHRAELNLPRLNYEKLSNTVSAMDGVGRAGIGIDQEHLDLAAKARVHETRCVETAHPMARREPTAGQDQSRVALGKCDGDSGRHECPSASGRQDHIHPRDKVDGCVAGTRIGGCRSQVFVKDHDGYLEHHRTVVECTGFAA